MTKIMEQVTEEYLKEQNACSESYNWLRKQKNRSWKVIANKLYDEEKYDWCLWLLYRQTISAKSIIWFLIVLSYLLSGISFVTNVIYESNTAAAVAAVAVAAAVTAAVAAAVAVATVAVAAAVAAVAAVAAERRM